MSRNRNNLTARQQLFFNELVGGKTFNQILTEHRIRPATVLRWTTEASFRTQWLICNQLLALRRGTDIATAPLPEPDPRPPNSPPTPEASSLVAMFTAPATNFVRQTNPPPKPRPSEREIVRSRYGEDGIAAFDRLREIRRRQAETKTVPVPVSDPDEGTPSVPRSNSESETDPVPVSAPGDGSGARSPDNSATNAHDDENRPRPGFASRPELACGAGAQTEAQP